ncbi:g5882 [Coccomyxa elongata]
MPLTASTPTRMATMEAVLSTICAASIYVEQLTPFCAGGLHAEGKEYCNNECIDPCANIPQAACLISPVPFYCQDTCLSAGVTLVDGVAKLTSDLSNSASNAGQGVVNCITNAFGGGCGR